MQDLTTGSISKHLIKSMAFMLVMMAFQTLYFLIDLYWVGRIGTEAVAAVGIAGNLTFVVLALTQMLGVGTTAIVSHAVGRKDQKEAERLFNQAQLLTIVIGVAFTIVMFALRKSYSRTMGADGLTAELANQYLLWFLPAMGLQFLMVAMGAALRATGNFKTGMVVGTVTVVVNMVLAPVFMFGWGTGRPMGVAGTAMATLVAVIVGVIWYYVYFARPDAYLRFHTSMWTPDSAVWKRILAIGLPTGFEFAMTALYLAIVYSVTRPFGAAAQAGFGIGQRIIQAGFMPVVALGFAVAPVAGQNFGARLADRVRATFKDAALMATGVMALFALLCHISPAAMIAVFSDDPAAIAVGEEYLRIVSWNYVASGLIFVASSMFQAMGNTVPSLVTSAVRITLVAIPVLWLSRFPGFQLHTIWYISVGAVLVHLTLSLLLLKREFNRRLSFT